jgi:DNA relaxase NicK
MSNPESLCDMLMIKAQYHEKMSNEGDLGQYFEIQIISEGKEIHFDIPLNSGELFSTELDVLASIIRARVMKARLEAAQPDPS